MLSKGDNVIIVVDENSFGFQRNIRNYLDNIMLLKHLGPQQDKSKFELPTIISAFSIKEEILEGSISIKYQLLQYN